MKRDCLLPITIVTSTLLLAGCQHMPQNPPDNPHDVTSAKYFGKIERMDPALDALIAPGTKIEKLAENFDWSEGPVWIKSGGYLLFLGVPMKIILKKKEGKKGSPFFPPTGLTGTKPRGGAPGAHGG